jgi:catechol 2,3-dioxygenase-like lactoylglutathione lyase family enzyme
MTTRFDHLVIAVRDLDSAIQRYQRLGFDVRPGGRHTGRGTYNALIRFGLDYIELISVYDVEEARASSFRSGTIVDLLQEHEELLLSYALATSEIEQDAERFRGTELFVTEPFAMQRTRPDGEMLSWRLFVPGGSSWRRSWPFIIQWDAPDEQRLQLEQPGTHVNGVIGWNGITVVARNLESALDLYQQRLGLALQSSDFDTRLHGRSATFHPGESRIELLQPEEFGPAQSLLNAIGEGPIEATFQVKNIDHTRRYLTQQGVAFEAGPSGHTSLLISPRGLSGIRFVFEQQPL